MLRLHKLTSRETMFKLYTGLSSYHTFITALQFGTFLGHVTLRSWTIIIIIKSFIYTRLGVKAQCLWGRVLEINIT